MTYIMSQVRAVDARYGNRATSLQFKELRQVVKKREDTDGDDVQEPIVILK